jgi:hypothetical protein
VGAAPLASVEVAIDPRAPQARAHDALLAAARSISDRARVELVSLDSRAARYKVTCENRPGLSGAIAEALAREHIALGAAAGP